MKKTIITIHGGPGTGKTDTKKYLHNLLPEYKLYSTGDIGREIGSKIIKEKNLNMDFNFFPKYARENKIPFDELIDDFQKKLENSSDKIILEGRLGYYFIPNSFKVRLKLSKEVAAQRIFNDPKRPEQKNSLEEIIEMLNIREESDKNTYLELYNTNYLDDENYDLIIDTENINQEQVAKKIYEEYNKWLAQ